MGLIKRFSSPDPLGGLLELVKLEQGLQADTEFQLVKSSTLDRYVSTCHLLPGMSLMMVDPVKQVLITILADQNGSSRMAIDGASLQPEMHI